MISRTQMLILGTSFLLILGGCGKEKQGKDEPVNPSKPEEVTYKISTHVDASGGGTITTSPSSSTVKKGTTVIFQANPDATHVFAGWSGDLSGTDNPKSVIISSNMNVGASFSLRSYPLNLSVEGSGTVDETVISSKAEYTAGTVVELNAKPADDWKFDHWEGDLAGKENPIQITISGAKSVKAVFVKKPYSLNISVEGEGTVSERIIETKADYTAGTVVELIAKPADEWRFDHWEGDLSGNDNPVQISIIGEKNVKAVFVRKTYNLTVSVEGEGSVEERIVETKAEYSSGTAVELIAKPADGWLFDHWEGDLSGNDNPVQISIIGEKNVKAVFVKKTYNLSVAVEGDGVVEEVVIETGIEIELQAKPAQYWTFDHWEGDLSGSDNPVRIHLEGNKSVKAVFKELSAEIKDNKFYSYLVSHFDSNSDGALSQRELMNIHDLDLSGEGFKTVDEIGKLKGLINFRCIAEDGSYGVLERLDLSSNKELETIDVKNQCLRTLILDNEKLRGLCCFNNRYLTGLNLSNSPELEDLLCWNNNISELDVSHNPKLRLLACAQNPISVLDVSKNYELRELAFNDTQVSSINLSNNPELSNLEIGKTPLSELNVSMNLKLHTLITRGCEGLTVIYLRNGQEIPELEKDGHTQIIYIGAEDITVSSVTVSPASLALEVGQRIQLSVSISPGNATDKSVTWTSSNTDIATVSDGLVTAIAEGNAVITAKAGGKSSTCAVSVKKSVVAVTSVTLSRASLNLTKGQSETLSATVSPDNATDKTVTWSSSDATIASVDQNGRVTALKSGNVTIMAKAGEKSATCSVAITTPVESVSLDRNSVNLEEGQSTTLVATINPNDADEKTVEWTTSNSSVATVANGVVTAHAEGNAVITATAGGKSSTCAVSVKKSVVAVTSVTLNRASLNLTKGQLESLSATVSPDNATDKTVTWSSSDATIASVDQNGRVTALKSGNVTIMAKAGEKSATCSVAITTPVESVSLDRNSVNLEEGQSTTLVATINPNDADEKTVEWTTSNSSVATVANGVVTAHAEGNAVITATAGGKSSTCAVSVKKSVVAVTSVTLNRASLNLTKGQLESLSATVSPDNATDKTVTWSSSDATIASVDQNGRVTALKSGNVTIMAKAGEKSATCSVAITTPVESVSLDRNSVNLEEGQSTTLVATINPNDADEKTVEWTTSNSSVATVANGVVTAHAEGNAVITATAGGKSSTCAVSVKKSVVAVTSVTLNRASLNLTKGQLESLSATVSPDNATDKTVTWSSSDATIASVDQNGRVTALKSGNVTIMAKAGEKSATCSVAITTPVESVSLDRNSVNLEEGQSTTLVATINPNDADEKTVEWTTSNSSVATVANGVVTAHAEGNAVITATAGGKSSTCIVEVEKAFVPVTSLTLDQTSVKLKEGDSVVLVATIAPNNATYQSLIWSSYNDSIAKVDQNGKVTARKSGNVTITVETRSGEKFKASCSVSVYDATSGGNEGFEFEEWNL